MKQAFLFLGISLVVSCALTSVCIALGWIQNYEPVPWPIGVNAPGQAAHAVKKQDFAIPEVKCVDEPLSAGYATDVIDSKMQTQAQYPINGTF